MAYRAGLPLPLEPRDIPTLPRRLDCPGVIVLAYEIDGFVGWHIVEDGQACESGAGPAPTSAARPAIPRPTAPFCTSNYDFASHLTVGATRDGVPCRVGWAWRSGVSSEEVG
jgi:hypothetical protein